MSATTVSIPWFLLPLRGQIWRRGTGAGARALNFGALAAANRGQVVRVRFASSSKPPPTKNNRFVLEKPEKFNPPSHGSRLPKKQSQHQPKHYGGELSAEQTRAQAKKEYPGMAPSRGSWAHWFINSRSIHLFITMGTLTGLALYTFVQNFKATSPYLDLVPAWSDFLWHPFSSIGRLARLVQLTEMHNSAVVAEKRDKRIDDVIKRRRYRKAHGMDESEGVAGWLRSGGSGIEDPEEEQQEGREGQEGQEGQEQAQAEPRQQMSAVQAVAAGQPGGVRGTRETKEEDGKEKGKKFLGIF